MPQSRTLRHVPCSALPRRGGGAAAIAVVVLAFLILTPGSARSWEADTHYGLVKWLAFKAGFSLTDAELVAAGSQSADESITLSATDVMVRTWCKDVEASRHVQQHHFPSGGYIPSLPPQRLVHPGHHGDKLSSNRWVRQEIYIDSDYIDRRTRLDRFGASLHPLADSWSHQGESDTIELCPDDLFWGHPANRGGITISPFAMHNHDADLTYIYPKDPSRDRDATEAAKTLYAFMVLFLDNNPSFIGSGRRHGWDDLVEDVRKFSRADKTYKDNDPNTKQAWFESKPEVWGTYTTYPCFLRKLNLEGSDYASCSPGARETPMASEPSSDELGPIIGENVPDEARVQMAELLQTWIVDREIETVVYKFIDADRVTERLALPALASIDATPQALRRSSEAILAQDRIKDALAVPDRWLFAMMNMWFAADHGRVNSLGHGMPHPGGFQMLAGNDLQQLDKLETLADAIHVPGLSATYQLVALESTGENNRYLSTFAFKHAPRDTIIVVMERVNTEWKITEFLWLSV
ncbi:MAG: hypothetical protein JJ855_18675 [Rhodospirillales bacterium]|nr:hypothetical protein [Rhodospirillales bacterium]